MSITHHAVYRQASANSCGALSTSPLAGRGASRNHNHTRTVGNRLWSTSCLIALTCIVGWSAWGADANERSSIVLEGSAAELVLDLNGGSIGDFHLKDLPLNPLRWATPEPGDKSNRAFGHFLCLDRWGAPSEAEGARGMPYHGEASHVGWRTAEAPHSKDGFIESLMEAKLPLAGLSVRRRVRLSVTQALFVVREDVTNDNPLGRIYNIVQHPTIGPPFLDSNTLVDCNGRKGFAQGNPMPHPEEPSFYWPAALNQEGVQVNLRRLTSDPNPNVVSYIIEDRHGWVTAANPARGLLIGYLWKTAEYPWVSLWRDVRQGQPSARGLEFGSTGLHQPFPILAKVGSIWNRPVFEHVDAGETVAKSYAAFLLKIPADFIGVQSLTVASGRLVIRERAGKGDREFVIPTTEDLLP